MRKKVPLQMITDEVIAADDSNNSFLDTETMEIIWIPEDGFEAEEIEEKIEMIEDDTENRFLALPTKYEINDYRIVQDFVYEISDRSIQEDFERAIRGSGAFRRFRNTLIRYDMLQDWYNYKDQAYREIAIEWCKDNGIEYLE